MCGEEGRSPGVCPRGKRTAAGAQRVCPGPVGAPLWGDRVSADVVTVRVPNEIVWD